MTFTCLGLCAMLGVGRWSIVSVGRQFQIVYTLLSEGQVSAPELAKRLEVSVRTIYRDIEALSLSGIPVYAKSGRNGGVSLLEGYTLDKSLMTGEERAQLMLAIKSVAAADRSLGEGLLNKLSGLMTGPGEDWLSVDFSRWGSAEEDEAKFAALKRAIVNKRKLSFDYAGSSGEIVRRTAKPAKLMFRSQAWYLLAFCEVREGWRLFRMHRMKAVQVLDEPCGDMPKPPEEPRAGSASLDDVHLVFAPQLAYRVYDEFAEQCIQIMPDGSLSVVTRMPADQWLLSYVMSFGAGVELKEPKWMRRVILECSKNIVAAYQET